jgi:putative DNA methylase
MGGRPHVLIEDWLPVMELGIESRREAAPIPGQFPKLKTLHVWWARRPLAASAGAVLGSLMPAWSERLAEAFPKASEFKTYETYQAWFLRLCGILGDPIAAKVRIARATENGITLGAAAYGYKQAFKNSPSSRDQRLLRDLLLHTWGHLPIVLDPTAGGGSIPYAAIRYGLVAFANDLNPVAVAVLRAGVSLPARFGLDLVNDLKRWGTVLVERVRKRLEPFFELPDRNSDNNSYIFARTVRCPRTGKPVPLSPNWWLSKGKTPTAVRLITERGGRILDQVEFEIVVGSRIDFDPDQGTVARGVGVSPWDGLAIEDDYTRSEAQAGRLSSQLYAVAIRTPRGRAFRAPTSTDQSALAAAEVELQQIMPKWLANNVLPSEEIPPQNPKWDVARWGMYRWTDMFSPRQLLVHGTFIEEFRRLIPEIRSTLEPDEADAVLTELALMQGKAINFDAILATWHASRETMRSVFERHDFAFKWTYAEFEGARELYPWCLDQIVDAYRGIAELLAPADAGPLAEAGDLLVPGPIIVTAQNAADLKQLSDGQATLICIDPPYYDNVMYAQLANFFYVWEKRTLGLLDPELFAEELCDEKNEAVANPTRFADAGRRKKELANADYEAKMTAIFAECHRVLAENGVLTVMFTHKRAEAWDTLGMALMEAGFTIETSWPVNTESEQSLHQANKNAAASTIMLVCRKRSAGSDDTSFFEDLEAEVRAAARNAVTRFSAAGIAGVDLLLATYGPALSVISSRWPVYSSEADELTGRARLLRPEEALDAARAEVVRSQRRRLVGRAAQLDPLSDFTLIAWDTFKAVEFPFDEARRLALAVGGLDVDELARAKLIEKKAGTVVLLPPAKRLRRGNDELPGVRAGATAFAAAIDAVHTVLYVADVDGLPAAKALIDRAGLAQEGRFLACLQGLVNAIPRARIKGTWVRSEAETLDRLCAAYFPDIEIPPDPATVEPLTLDI